MRNHTSRRIALSLLFLTGLVLPALADDKRPSTPAAPKLPEAIVEARGERQLRQLNYSGWRKLCFRPSQAAAICRTTIAGVSETGQEMLRIDLIENDPNNGGRLQIFLPPMLFLGAGVRIAIDGGAAVRLPFAWCFSNTCVAAHAVDSAFVRQMKVGREITLKVVDARVSTVTTSLSLDQFAAVNQGPPTLTFGESLEAAAPQK
jgi:invasion protein IalB